MSDAPQPKHNLPILRDLPIVQNWSIETILTLHVVAGLTVVTVLLSFLWRQLGEPNRTTTGLMEMYASVAGETNDLLQLPEGVQFANNPFNQVTRNAVPGTMYRVAYRPYNPFDADAENKRGQSEFLLEQEQGIFDGDIIDANATDPAVVEKLATLTGMNPYSYEDVKSRAAAGDTSAKWLMDRGGKLFRNNCGACHGNEAIGNPAIGSFGIPAPSLVDAIYKAKPDGFIYWTMTHGKRAKMADGSIQVKMPSQRDRVEPDDRWKIILHLRHLQEQKEKLDAAGTPPAGQ